MDEEAVVVAVKKRKAVILVSGGIFEEIQNQGYAVGQKICGKNLRSRHTSVSFPRGLMIAACLALLISFSALAIAKNVHWVRVTVAYGEATVQYRLNALNEVLSASADTQEGQALLESVPPALYEPIGSVMEDSLAVMQNSQGSEAGLHVEIAPRFGDGRRAEEAIAESAEAHHMEMTLERKPWNDAGRPHDAPGQDRVPTLQPEDIPTPVEDIQGAPAEGLQTPADGGQLPPGQERPAYDDHEQNPAMNGQPASGDVGQNRLSEEQPKPESGQDRVPSLQPERDQDGQLQPADGQTFPDDISQSPLRKEPSASPGDGQNMPMEGQPPPGMPENERPEGMPGMNGRAP